MPSEFHPIRTVRVGPLPGRWLTLALGLALPMLGILFALTTLHRRILACDRTGPDAGTCRQISETPWSSSVELRFAISDVREVRWVDTTGPKGGNKGETVIVFANGHQIRVADGPQPASRAAHDRIKNFFDIPGGTALRERVEQPRWFLLFALAMFVAGLVFLVVFARAVTALRVELDADGRLRVTPLYHGFPGRARVLSPGDWREVRQEASATAHWYQRSSEPTVSTARIVLVRADGTPVPVLVGFTPAVEVVRRGAEELAAALGLGEEPAPPAAARSAGAPGPSNPYNVKIPIKTLVWIGIGLTAVSLIFLIVVPRLSGETGRLSVKCTHRCRFHGTECLPGGSWSSPLKPGVYELQVWNPDVPGNWETVLVEVQDGGNTHFTCRPRSGGPPPSRSTP